MTESASDFLELLRELGTPFLWHLPYYLVWLVGLFLALARWRQHPMPSLLATIAFILFLVDSITGTLLFAWILRQRDSTGPAPLWIFNILALGQTAVSVVAWVLLLLALFGWRTPPQPRHLPREAVLDDAQPAVPDTGIRKGRPG
jgi:hypothetical protein